MYIKDGKLTPADITATWENDSHTFWWEGLLFIKGVGEGLESVKTFADRIKNRGLENACESLSGNFACAALDKASGEICAFTDNSRLAQFYHDGSVISTSFLQLLDLTGRRAADLLPGCVSEFILAGSIYSKDIFFSDIRTLEPRDIAVCGNSGISIKQKFLRDIFKTRSHHDFLDLFKKTTESFRGRKVLCHLTGGTDTRLIAIIFRSLGLPFDTGISGAEDHYDVQLSKQAAGAMGLKHVFVPHVVTGFDDELKDAFDHYDGLQDPIYFHRLWQFGSELKRRGYEIDLSGLGGELMKDGGPWQTAFRTTSPVDPSGAVIKNLVRSGIVGFGIGKGTGHRILAGEYKKFALDYSAKLLKLFDEGFREKNKYLTSDRIFYDFTMRPSRGNEATLIKRYKPFVDPDVTQIGIHLPPGKRFFHRFYRDTAAALDPKIARMTTSRVGMTMSTDTALMLDDFRKFAVSVATNKHHFCLMANNPMLYKRARQLKDAPELFDLVRGIGALAPDVTLDSLDDNAFGRVLALGMLIRRIGR